MSLGIIASVQVPTLESPFLQKPMDVIETAFSLYGFLPGDQDERWEFLARYRDIEDRTGFSRMNFANAWGATYLSDIVGYRRGYVCTVNPENNVQLARALDNLDAVEDVAERFAETESDSPVDVRLSLTDRLTTDTGAAQQPVTPCPEALYQVQLYDGEYLGRVGFNVHREDYRSVLSIVNIQGVPAGGERIIAFKEEHGLKPFNLLAQRVVALASAGSADFVVRGLTNPARGNSQLYWGVLRKEKIDMYHAHRRPQPLSTA